MTKLFGGINLTWLKLIIFAVIAGVYTGLINQVEFLYDTSFRDIAISFECWIFFGTVIIMNSKSNIDSALKCFVFFLISQPLVYLTEVPFQGWGIMGYYRNWIVWTILTLPMGFIGYYLKKDKWWGLFILTPVLVFLGIHYYTYLGMTIFFVPHHLLSCIFCVLSMIIFSVFIFSEKKVRIAGIIISCIILISMTVLSLSRPVIYNTTLLMSGGEKGIVFDDSYTAELADDKFGTVNIEYESGIEEYMLNAHFRKAGRTEFTLESPDGEKYTFEINIKKDNYEITQK